MEKKEEKEKIKTDIQLVNDDIFKRILPKIESILMLTKTKLQSSKPNLLLKPENVEVVKEDLKPLFEEACEFPIKDNDQFSIIFDCLNFIHYSKDNEKLTTLKRIDQTKLNSLFTSVKDKGTLILLADYIYLRQLPNALKKTLGENYLTKLFIKLYVIYKKPIIGILFIQKMNPTEKPINLFNEKLLSYEIYDDLLITKPVGYTVSNMTKALSYMYEIYRYQDFHQTVHPGEVFPIPIKETFYSDSVDCYLTIIDTTDQSLLEKKTCAAIVVGKDYNKEFLNLSKQGFVSLCNQVQATRVVLVRPSSFNFDNMYQIKEKMNSYVIIFTFKDCTNIQTIPVLFLNSNNESSEVYREGDIIIKDWLNKAKKETIRQLSFSSNVGESQSEIKLILTSKTRTKQDSSYITVKTEDKYLSKGFVYTFDDKVISSFYDKVVLSGLLFTNLSTFPQNRLNVLILGAGIGTISYYLNKIFLGKVNIDNVEKNKDVTNLGKIYFGTNDYQIKNSNIKWHFEDAFKLILDSKNEQYYDLVIMDIKDITRESMISPNEVFFEDELLKKLTSMMKQTGMYVLNIKSRSYQKYYEAYCSLEKHFGHIFLIENTEDLNKIHFCYKQKNDNNFYNIMYQSNMSKLSNKEIADDSIIKEEYQSILSKLFEASKFKELLEYNTK